MSSREVWLRFASSIASSATADIDASLATQIGKEADCLVKEWELRSEAEPGDDCPAHDFHAIEHDDAAGQVLVKCRACGVEQTHKLRTEAPRSAVKRLRDAAKAVWDDAKNFNGEANAYEIRASVLRDLDWAISAFDGSRKERAQHESVSTAGTSATGAAMGSDTTSANLREVAADEARSVVDASRVGRGDRRVQPMAIPVAVVYACVGGVSVAGGPPCPNLSARHGPCDSCANALAAIEVVALRRLREQAEIVREWACDAYDSRSARPAWWKEFFDALDALPDYGGST